jgi:acetylornithine deacetylase/succinyl-diaminopimelate desuccinylase-like protein
LFVDYEILVQIFMQHPVISRLLDLAITIQQIPAPTFHEAERARFVHGQFAAEGLKHVEIDSTGNVYGCLESARRQPSTISRPLVVSAHLDTVFPSSVDLHYVHEPECILAPGIGDNSLGVAGLIGLIWMIRERKITLPGDLWLVANACEEGLGNLRGMRALVDRFEADPQAYLVVEGLALGQVYHRGLGVRRYRITVRTSGGHSWIDYGQPSAIHELTAISTHIAALELPRSPRSTLNVGVISGGSSVNTIAAEAMLELDLRSEDAQALETLVRQVEQITHSAEKPGVTIELEVIGQRPSGELPADHPLVKLAQDCLRAVGSEPRLNIGSTDANLPLSRGLPSVAIGLTTGGRAHTVHEFMNIAPLENGMEQLIRLVSKVWDQI